MNPYRKYIVEFIGTFLLVVTIGFSSGNALAIGAVLAAMVYMGGYISGGHYNPAVTLAILLQKKIPRKEAGKYMLVQLAAAILAAGVFRVVHGYDMFVGPAFNVSFAAALLVEILFTFALVSVVLHTAVSKRVKDNNYYGVAIGFVLMAGVFAGGHISGGAYNPAVGLGPNLYDLASLSSHLSNILLYLIGPFAGGLLASVVFNLTAEK